MHTPRCMHEHKYMLYVCIYVYVFWREVYVRYCIAWNNGVISKIVDVDMLYLGARHHNSLLQSNQLNNYFLTGVLSRTVFISCYVFCKENGTSRYTHFMHVYNSQMYLNKQAVCDHIYCSTSLYCQSTIPILKIYYCSTVHCIDNYCSQVSAKSNMVDDGQRAVASIYILPVCKLLSAKHFFLFSLVFYAYE